MSQIAFQGNASGTGTFTIAAPNSNTNRSLTLPDAAGEVVLDSATQTLTNKIIPLKSGTSVATTSGTFVDFTGIPSWVKRITVMFTGVSTSGVSSHRLQLGSTSITTSGYASVGTRVYTTVTAASSTTGFDMPYDNAAFTSTGTLVLTNISGNTWICSGIVASTTSTVISVQVAGSVTLAGVLDRIRITTANGTDTFDAGSVNIIYE
jgi:hypothetical protein